MSTVTFEIERTIAESIVAEPEVHDPVIEIDPRVLRGVEFLDEHEPGWAMFINLEAFDLSIGNQCVFGQIQVNRYGMPRRREADNNPYRAALERYGIVENDADEARIGVNVNYEEGTPFTQLMNEFRALEADWRIVIAERQLG